VSPEQLLGQIEGHLTNRVVVADMEAGAGTLTRMDQGSLDIALLIVEPSAKSIDVARRAQAIIAERQIGLSLVVANRVRDAEDLELVRRSFPGLEVIAIPEDPSVSQADREARSPVDLELESRGVQAVGALATRLDRWVAPVQEGNVLTMVSIDQ
jgi:CO dehydrogenase maturation factor